MNRDVAKALFFSLPLHGHTNPSLALVRELADRGDEIVYYSAEPFARAIERNNARYRPYANAFLADMRSVPERMDQLSWLLMRTTADVLEKQLEAFGAERPDYVLADSVAPWGQWAAEILGVPVVTSISTFAFNRRVVGYGVAHGVRPSSARMLLSKIRYIGKSILLRRRLQRRYRAKGPSMMGTIFGHSNLNIVYTSRYFQPCAETFDHRFLFVGPSIEPRGEDLDFPWNDVRHPVVVYASLGTLFNTDATFYRNCFEAFRDEDLHVVLSVGTSVPPTNVGVAPPNFIVRKHVPQLDVLRRAAAFVTHGGMNSVSESLFHGVPVVVIPQMSEQAIVGRRVEELGAGLYLAKGEATADNLRQSVRRLLADEGFRRQAALVRASFSDAGGTARAASGIVAFTRKESRQPMAPLGAEP